MRKKFKNCQTYIARKTSFKVTTLSSLVSVGTEAIFVKQMSKTKKDKLKVTRT